MYKQFDQKLHDDNDPETRKVVLYYLQSLYGIPEHHYVENPDKYGIDIIQRGLIETISGIEVERRHNWTGDYFPFDTINIPERKKKFSNMGFPTYYIATNKELTRGIIIDITDINIFPLKENKNKYVAEGEMFYSVPISAATYINLGHKHV